jgi:hypothetical protein
VSGTVRRARLAITTLLATVAVAGCGSPSAAPTVSTTAAGARHDATPTPAGIVITTPGASGIPAVVGSTSNLLPQVPGQAAGLPALPPGVPFTGHLLIAENSGHSRVLEINPQGQVTWSFLTTAPPLSSRLGPPDDVFYVPGSTNLITMSSEDGQGALELNRQTGRAVWQLGAYYQYGDSATRFHNPDDAVPSADGTVWMADIINCRLLHLNGTTGAVIGTLGAHGCRHDPPTAFADPNGAFPTADGSLVVTEIGGQWVSWLNPDGSLLWTHHVPAAYPSDAMGLPDGSVLFTDYSYPGSVIRMAASGAILWRYSPRGASMLNHPSIAIPIASNRVAIVDDFDNRIVIVDPTTSQVVWQWSGSGSYQLLHPDGVDYSPS